MARRMIDPQVIIKSQIVDDKESVDLLEILEKYGTQHEWGDKSITLQFYSKLASDDNNAMVIYSGGNKGYIITNSATTITKTSSGDVYISGLIVGSLSTMNLLDYIEINAGDYENGITLERAYPFDVHVIKV